MVYEARRITKDVIPKPEVVIDKRFPELRDLEIGDEGHIDVTLQLMGTSLRPDINDIERLNLEFLIKDAKLMRNISKRL